MIPYDASWDVRQYASAGGTLQTPVRRGSQTLQLRLPRTRPLRISSLFERVSTDVGITFALLLAAYLGFRKPSVMIAALILFLGGGALAWPDFVALFSALPDALYVPFAWMMVVLCDWFPVMALASFAIRLPGGVPPKPQQTAIRIVDAVVVASFCGAFALVPSGLFYTSYIACTAFSGIVVLLASLAALMFARPADRGRTGIVFAGVMVGGVGYAANMIGLRLGEPYWLFTVYANVSVIVVSLSLAYAILRHRVFDVAFVLNRTIVFALTSALVLVVFAALEFIVERFLSDVTHVAGIILQFGIALVVTLSVRLLHRRADFLVDSVLFRSRHEDETALRRFASTVQFYTEEGPLERDTVDVLLRYGRVEGAAIYLAQESGLKQMVSSFPVAAPEIDHNDMAYVELRAHHEPLHVHTMPTALPGDRLYPMIRAGRIIGVIATGERQSGEEMPPDIDDAIRRIAHAAATSLGAIESDQIRSELNDLRLRLGFSS
ncbi:MAG TPA: hypothetical protein VFE36_04020 [Candidatus Baltobacteraceae bacterium]|nr:hypothetical protein [Candidatus Baltobacteraceae bacterium]